MIFAHIGFYFRVGFIFHRVITVLFSLGVLDFGMFEFVFLQTTIMFLVGRVTDELCVSHPWFKMKLSDQPLILAA